ncbi:MAG TPA: maleylpyruvate isomerase N-terminal domain-containing protein [Anaerolineales bacterium]|nr:maleylpyruvate isomerase N-terminal domain-containing protein [Anaerolineales bacterium]
MNAFDPDILAADLLEVKRIFAAFFAARSPADWQRHTESHNRGWTLRETTSHLDAVGQAYLQAAEAALAGQPCHIPGMLQRTDLPAWNQRQIEERAPRPITDICDSFLSTLQQAADSVARLSPAVLNQKTVFPVYHRPISVGELFAGQAAHPGLVHAAQVARGAGSILYGSSTRPRCCTVSSPAFFTLCRSPIGPNGVAVYGLPLH